MFDIGWDEIVFVAIMALIIIGPEDLPKAVRSISQFIDRLRGIAKDFVQGMNKVADETELTAFKDDLKLINIDLQQALDKKLGQFSGAEEKPKKVAAKSTAKKASSTKKSTSKKATKPKPKANKKR